MVIDLQFRSGLCFSEVNRMKSLLFSTGVFSRSEIDVVEELALEHINKGIASGYHFITCQTPTQLCGFSCFGPDACSNGSWHLYWLAVDRNVQHEGIAGSLLQAVKKEILPCGGRSLYAETSSKVSYAPARSFYEKSGFGSEALLKDFYDVGDDKVIYSLRL
ncbi:GNAT family N-acetyltransferase [Halodesulfovibrio aestuarii]|uniref:GNAT family N-acetyltransferase n=1 Tax=Halodesulfovibrio aestuarii TaxID=126333 RepID=UPI0004279B7B